MLVLLLSSDRLQQHGFALNGGSDTRGSPDGAVHLFAVRSEVTACA